MFNRQIPIQEKQLESINYLFVVQEGYLQEDMTHNLKHKGLDILWIYQMKEIYPTLR